MFRIFQYLAAILLLLAQLPLAQDDDLFLGAKPWLVFRKDVRGTRGQFGVGYNFTIAYEIENIGTAPATHVSIQDEWDMKVFQRFDGQVSFSNSLHFFR